MTRIRDACIDVKIRLSFNERASIHLRDLIRRKDMDDVITRSEFENLCKDLFCRTTAIVNDVLKEKRIKRKDIDDIVMIGGSTRIPVIQQLVSEFFFGRELKLDINPDEAVAYGAVIHAAVLSKSGHSVPDFRFRDVTPLSLGTDLEGGLMSVIIPRNTPLPTAVAKEFQTIKDDQTNVLIQVYQGERKMFADNIFLGEYEVTGIPKAKRGKSVFSVTFELDKSGQLTVKAQPKEGAGFQTLVISNSCNLSDVQVEFLKTRAEVMRQDDAQQVQRAKLRNRVYTACYKNQNDEYLGVLCQETMRWLEENPYAQTSELRAKLDAIIVYDSSSDLSDVSDSSDSMDYE